jgi:carbon monoxide dehydrogenase subunit G
MELTNEFVIDRNVEDAWKILNDLEFIAPCMPGAQLTEVEGDEYRGLVKIKVGPITANYKGKASFIEQDADAKISKLKAEGRDPRQGNANAMVTATMEEVGADETKVTIHTDLGLSGKIASFGRGAIDDVSKKLLGQFTDNLRAKLENDSDPAAADATPNGAPAVGDASAAGATDAAAAATTGSAGTATSSSGVRKIDAPEAEPVDLLAATGGAVAKRAIPAAGAAAVILAILYWIVRS